MAARGWQAPEDAAAQWLRLEREHFAAFTTGAITFEEQRRRRLRAFLPLVTGADVVEEDLDDLFAEYATFYESHWVAFDDARAVLDDLAAAGYVLGVLTNGQRAQQLAKLARVGLLDRFAVVVASSELPAGKPDPRAFTALCQRLGTAPGSVMFVGDDPVTDVAGARGAGLQAVLLDRDQAGRAPDGVDQHPIPDRASGDPHRAESRQGRETPPGWSSSRATTWRPGSWRLPGPC